MTPMNAVASYAARVGGHSHVTYVTGRGFPVWGIVLILIAIILLLALLLARPYGRYRSRRYIDMGPPMASTGGPAGSRTVVEEEDIA